MNALPIPINLSPILPYFSSSLIRSTSGLGVSILYKNCLMLSGCRFSKMACAVSFSKRAVSRGIAGNKIIGVVLCAGGIDITDLRLWSLSDLIINGSRLFRNSLLICCKRRKFVSVPIIVKNYANERILASWNNQRKWEENAKGITANFIHISCVAQLTRE